MLNILFFFLKGFLTKTAIVKATSCDPEGDLAKFRGNDPGLMGTIDKIFDEKFSKDPNFVCEKFGQFIGNPCLGSTATQQKTFDW